MPQLAGWRAAHQARSTGVGGMLRYTGEHGKGLLKTDYSQAVVARERDIQFTMADLP